jgi:tRNA A-37 threonylcarbamoyl transferase component Bud32
MCEAYTEGTDVMVNDDTPKPHSAEGEETAVIASSPVGLQGTLLKDRYRLIRQLSSGGFGSVYLAQDQQMHDRLVVVKIQNARMVEDPWFERKFNEEVRALSMIDHPGVVVAIDSGRTADGKPFLVMQYVEGITLRAVMSPEGMPLERAAQILKQVGHALGAAHDKGIWHRDLKPENLMLEPTTSSGERVRLIDFGIATIADPKAMDETNTRVAGSVLYMAPEQRFGQPSALTDIYAMGLIAYEMVTGRKPFIAQSFDQLDALQRSGLRIKPSDLRPGLTLAAERLIQRSLEYEPSKRPQDAREFGDQLQDLLLQSDATRIVAPRGVQKKRRRWMIAVVAVPIVMAAAGLYYEWRMGSSPNSKAQPAAPSDATVKDAASEQVIELAFWNSVKDSTEPQLYREYLLTYPHGRFRSLAQAKLDILSRKQAPKPAPAQAAALTKENKDEQEQEVELTFWNSVKDGTEPQLYRDYLEKYPHGRFESVARTKLEILTKKAERDAVRAQHRRPTPDMPDMPDFRLEMAPPKMSVELSDFLKLKDTKNPQAYRDYLTKYPNGNFATVVRIKLSALENAPPKAPQQP